MRTHIIHTNEIDVSFGSYDAAEEAAREALLEDHEEDEITADMIWRWIYDVMEINGSDFWREVERVSDGPWLVIADIGTWRGRFPGGKVFDTLRQAVSEIVSNMDCVTIEETERGSVHATCVHHDGRNHFDVYRLSDRGRAWYENHGDNLDWQTICETLAKTYNRRAPHLRKAFGWVA